MSNEFCIVQNFSLLSGLSVNMCAFVAEHMCIGQGPRLNLKKKNPKDALFSLKDSCIYVMVSQ